MTPSPAQPARHRPGLTLLTACFGTLLVLVGYTSPLTTLSPTALALHIGASAQTWVLTGTLVGLAALLLTMGSAADDYGRKRVFGAGAVLLLISTALSALATDTAVFLAGRVLQGCAAAAILAPTLGLIGNVYPVGPTRVKALGRWGAAVGLGIAVGPIYAALLEKAGGWRTVYWVLSALSAVLVLLAAFGLDESRTDRPRKVDPFGVLTLTAGSSALIAGLSEGRHGWGRPVVLVLFAVGVLLLVLFTVVEAKVAEPMLDLALFRSPGFIASSGGALFTGLSIVGLMSYLPTVLQKCLNESQLTASLVLAIWSGLSVISSLQARRLATRMAAATQVASSLLLCGVGEAALYGLKVGDSWTHLAPGLIITGIGSGILNAALARLAVSSVPPNRAAMGSGANNSARYLGSAMGVAIMITVVSQATSAKGPKYAMAEGANSAILVAAMLCGVGALVALWARTAEARTTGAAAPSDLQPVEPAAAPAGARD